MIISKAQNLIKFSANIQYKAFLFQSFNQRLENFSQTHLLQRFRKMKARSFLSHYFSWIIGIGTYVFSMELQFCWSHIIITEYFATEELIFGFYLYQPKQ